MDTQLKFNTFRRLIVLAIFFLTSYTNTIAQTFIYNPYYTPQQPHIDDTLSVGPLSFGVTSDHKVFALVRLDTDLRTNLIQYDSLGNELLNTLIGFPWTLSFVYTTKIYIANNDDCVFASNRIGSYFNEAIAYRYNPNGNLAWSIDYNPSLSNAVYTAISKIKPTWNNTTLIQFGDSLDEIDSVGNLIQRSFNIPGDFVCIPGNEIILFDNGQISRQTLSGVQAWNISGNGTPIYADSSYFYVTKNDSVIKYRINNGSIVWNKYIPHYDISVNKNGEIMKCGASLGVFSNEICKYDSAGNLIWSRIINFPKYGFTSVAECTPNCIFTGGATANFDHIYTGLLEFVNAFVCSIDSTGHGVIDSTTHFISGNSNDNNLLGFTDDAPLVAAAIGNTGSPRCSEMQNSQIPYNTYFRAVFATDWSTQFGIGLNHKYADVNGDGIVDSQDLLTFATLSPGTSISLPHWRISSPNATGSSNFLLSIEQDSVIAGDSVTVDVILGNANTPIDSIYSIAFSFQSDHLFQNGGQHVNLPVSDFGDQNIDLDSLLITYYMTDFTSLLLYRTNHLNATLLYDTIASFRIPTPSAYSSKYYSLSCIANAVTKEGFSVTLNIESDSVYYSDPLAGIQEMNENHISIYPNPANNQLFIECFKSDLIDIRIFNASGTLINLIKQSGNKIILNLDAFQAGYYTTEITTQLGISHKSFIVVK